MSSQPRNQVAEPPEPLRAPHTPRFIALLAALFGLEFVVLGIAPRYRQDWALENVIVVAAIVVLARYWRRLPLSNASYALIFLFLSLHEIGSHYTYSEVPYDDWFRSLSGRSLNSLLGWERNNYDRVIHFSSGLLLALPARELTRRLTGQVGFWTWLVPLSLLFAAAGLYELIEWAASLIFGQDLGMAYLGTQGDIWDAHKDMALAHLGAVLAFLVVVRLRRR